MVTIPADSVTVKMPAVIPTTMITGIIKAGSAVTKELPICRAEQASCLGKFRLEAVMRTTRINVMADRIPGVTPAMNRSPMDRPV